MTSVFWSITKICWENAKGKRGLIIIVYFLLLISNICLNITPFIYGWFINSIQKDGFHAIKYTWQYVLIYFALFVIQYATYFPSRIIERKLAFQICKNFSVQNFSELLQLPLEWHKMNHSGATINNFSKAKIGIRDLVQNGSVYIRTIMQLVISVFSIIYLSSVFGIVALVFGCFVVYLILLFDKPYLQSLQNFNDDDNRISANLSDSLTNIFTIKVLRLGNAMKDRFAKSFVPAYGSFKKNINVNEQKWLIVNLLVASIYCIVILGFVDINISRSKILDIGGLVTLIAMVVKFTNVFYNIAIQYNDFLRLIGDILCVRGIKDALSNFKNIESFEQLPKNWIKLEIRNVSFSYPFFEQPDSPAENNKRTKRKILENVSLEFYQGDKICITGGSGTGKSTLLAILKGLYYPDNSAELIIQGKKHEWMKLSNDITFFPQEPEIFEQSIRFNITMGINYTDSEIRTACEIVMFDEVLAIQANGLETIIKENGSNLSVGQKQRLALARGVLASKNSSIMLLDEPTSNIDEGTAARIYANLINNFPDKVIICIIHQISLLQYFDYTYLLKDGTLTRLNSETIS